MFADGAGIRMSDIVNNVRMSSDWDDIKNGWMAFKLADGSSDGTIYDNRNDAIWFNRNKADHYFYLTLRNCVHGMTPKEATAVLTAFRVQSARGRYNPRPDEPSHDPILPITQEDLNRELSNVGWVK